MTFRPIFQKIHADIPVSAEIYNKLVEFYNELGNAYEDLCVTDKMRKEVIARLDVECINAISSVAEHYDESIRAVGEKAYRKAVLAGEKQPLMAAVNYQEKV